MTAHSSWSDLSIRIRRRTRTYVLRRDGQRCQLRLPGCTTIATTVDHILPREIAGDGPANLRAACETCNIKRGRPGRDDPPHRASASPQW